MDDCHRLAYISNSARAREGLSLVSTAERDRIENSIATFRGQPGPLLLVLHAIQRDFGYVPAEAVAVIAAGLNLSRAEVHGVLTFYHHFRSAPPGRHVVRLCRAEACQAMQAEELALHAQQRLRIAFHETTGDGNFSLEPVFCLGNCGCSPAMMIDEELYGRVTAGRFDELIAEHSQ
jgi:formate dehydrogenase subunit gamma